MNAIRQCVFPQPRRITQVQTLLAGMCLLLLCCDSSAQQQRRVLVRLTGGEGVDKVKCINFQRSGQFAATQAAIALSLERVVELMGVGHLETSPHLVPNAHLSNATEETPGRKVQ